jgi:hypothetical protein
MDGSMRVVGSAYEFPGIGFGSGIWKEKTAYLILMLFVHHSFSLLFLRLQNERLTGLLRGCNQL